MPQRFLRPGLTRSQRYNGVSWEAQALFTRLITLVDDFGRYDAEPRLLRSHAFPFGDPGGKDIPLPKIDSMCAELSKVNLVDFYQAPDGKKYLAMTRWNERPRTEKSKFPGFDNTCEQMFANDIKCSLPSSSPSSLSHKPSSSFLVPATAPAVVRDKFEKWMVVRRGMGKAPKDWSDMFAEQFGWLESFPETDRVEILSQSIRNNWQGLFEVKGKNGAHQPNTTESRRNVGTANEGKSSQYKGVGRV